MVLMIQGTMSNVGKSVLTAGFCRIFKQDGYSVAPFKSQNMALNSFITNEGLEMGRAQVMQAEAAGIAPSVLMNPVLLKPTNDTGSQVIVCGEVLGNMSAMEYHNYKKTLAPKVLEAYEKLAEIYDVVVIEGAGSPAEINLHENDIVNMGMAKMADSPVILVGDIDRGGVFASVAGTLMLLTEEERARVKGVIINKFRGDVEILKPGIKMLEDITHVPVLGVIPHTHLDIDDEDSLSSRLDCGKTPALIDIVVIRLPRISNFTDFNVFEMIDGVGVRYVNTVGELGSPDMIILPGTKNTMEDLLWLRQSGLESEILKHHSKNKPIFGICGGYQMLGQELQDPYNIEHGGTIAGLSLLPVTTIFEKEKTRTRAIGHFSKVSGVLNALSGVPFEGYEIHMGQTSGADNAQFLTTIENTTGVNTTTLDGMYKENVYGSYVHGIFDKDEVVKAICKSLFEAKGLDYSTAIEIDMESYKQAQYDKLAEVMRKNIDMDAVYKILHNVE